MAQNWFYQPGTVLNLNQAGSVMNPTLLLCDCLPHICGMSLDVARGGNVA